MISKIQKLIVAGGMCLTFSPAFAGDFLQQCKSGAPEDVDQAIVAEFCECMDGSASDDVKSEILELMTIASSEDRFEAMSEASKEAVSSCRNDS